MSEHMFFSIIVALIFVKNIRGTTGFEIIELQTMCKANCLKDFKQNVKPAVVEFLNRKPEMIMTECSQKDKVCQSCCSVCDKMTRIQNTTVCSQYCSFTRDLTLYNNKNLCLKNCEFMKNRIMHACGITPTDNCFKNETRPPIPLSPKVVTTDDKTFELDWASFNLFDLKSPVIFLVQINTCSQKEFDRSQTSGWSYILTISRKMLSLDSLDQNVWYTIRLAAFNWAGFNGYSDASPPFKMKTSLPQPVQKLRETSMRIQDNRVNVSMEWEASSPYAHYNITWMLQYGTGASALTAFSSVTSKPTFSIRDLAPGTTYHIQVFSILKFPNKKDVSSPSSSLYVTTPQAQDNVISEDVELMNVHRLSDFSGYPEKKTACPCEDISTNLFTINNSYVEEGILKTQFNWHLNGRLNPYLVTLNWRAEVCISTNKVSNYYQSKIKLYGAGKIDTPEVNKFILNQLEFNCLYSLNVSALTPSDSADRYRWSTCFCTPSCASTTRSVHQDWPIKCPIHTPLPEKPHNIQYKLLDSVKNYESTPSFPSEYDSTDNELVRLNSTTILVHWDAPSEDLIILGYRVVWAPRLEEPVAENAYKMGLTPPLDETKSQSKVFREPITQIKLDGLLRGKLYIVRVQTLTSFGESAISQIFFTVPIEPNDSSKSKENAGVSRHYSSSIHLVIIGCALLVRWLNNTSLLCYSCLYIILTLWIVHS